MIWYVAALISYISYIYFTKTTSENSEVQEKSYSYGI